MLSFSLSFLLVVRRHHVSSELLFHGRAWCGPLPGGHVLAGHRLHRPALPHRAPVHPLATQPLQETQEGRRGGKDRTCAAILLVWMLSVTITGVCFCQALALAEEALQPEDRDVAEERKRVLDCQPVVESMVGSPLILQELSKVCGHIVLFGSKRLYVNVCTTRFQFPLVYFFLPFVDGLKSPTDSRVYKTSWMVLPPPIDQSV